MVADAVRENERSAWAAEPSFSVSAGRPRVLIADADGVGCRVAQQDLGDAFDITVVHDGKSCLEVLAAHTFDLILLDLHLPGVDAFGVLEQLRDEPPTVYVPIIVLSGTDERQVCVRALRGGAADFVVKPWLQAELLARVRTHLRLREREASLNETLEQLHQRSVALSEEVADKRRAESQLIMADRMSSLGTVAAGVAHEINNPLTYVLASVERLQMDLQAHADALPEAVRARMLQATQFALEGSERVASIVNDLRTFSRPDRGGAESTDAQDVLDAVLRVLKHELKHVGGVQPPDEPLPKVVANAPRLGQVLLNVILNAAQAMHQREPEHCVLSIAVECEQDDRVALVFRDTGPGFAEEVLRAGPDACARDSQQGRGLGLALCQRILRPFGGQLVLRNRPEGGAEVRVVLRRYHDRKPAEAPARPRRELGRTRVLVVDDEPAIRAAVTAMLGEEHDVCTAAGGLDGLAMLSAGEPFDAVLCDLMMSPIGGAELYQRALVERPELQGHFVFMTGGACNEEARRALEEHPEAVLEKPFGIDRLHGLLRVCTEGHGA